MQPAQDATLLWAREKGRDWWAKSLDDDRLLQHVVERRQKEWVQADTE